MKKAISISIGGIVFNIEEDAYSSLQQYLNKLHRIFAQSEGGDEIMEDIEIRISELFNQKIKNNTEAINQQHVEAVITILGQPEEYEIEGDYEAPEHSQSQKYYKSKKLYRDTDDKIIAGVCSGLAHHFGWDITWVRLGFVVLMFFPPFVYLAYIILWMVIPKALTTSEKLQMRGKSVTIENIKKKVDQSFNQVKESIEKVSEKNGFGRMLDTFFGFLGHLFNLLIEFFGAIFKVLGKVFKVTFGILFLFLGSVLLFSLISSFFVPDSIIINSTPMGVSSVPYSLLEPVFLHGESSMSLLIIGGILLTLPLLLTFFYWGSKMLFNYKTNIKGWGLMMFFSIIVGTVLIAVVGIRTALAYSNQTDVVERFYTGGNHLEVKLFDDPYFSSKIKHHKADFVDLLAIKNDSIVLGYTISLDLEPTNENEFIIEIEKSSRGETKMDAIDNINRMTFQYEEYGNQLFLSPNILVPAKDKYHGQEIEVTVYIPEGKTLSLGDNIHRIYFRDWRLCSASRSKRNCDNEVFTNTKGHISTGESSVDLQTKDHQLN